MAEIELTTKYLEAYKDAENTYDVTLDNEGIFTEEQGTHIVDTLSAEVEIERDPESGEVTYTSNATGEEYEMDAYVRTGTGDDAITGSKGNDWINTDDGADVVFGGEGHDMISTGAGADVVVAGTLAAKKSSKTVEIAELSTEEEKVYATLGTVGSEIYAGAGADVVYGSNGDDYIYGQSGDDKIYAGNGVDWIYAGKGNDVIDLAGTGDKTVFVYNEDANFKETILNANAGDKLQLAAQFGEEDFRGYSLENLTFNRVREYNEEGVLVSDNLEILTANAGAGLTNGTIVVDGFFESNAAIDAVDTLEAGEVKTNSIFKDATINVGLVDGETYNASRYNENFSVTGAATVTGLTAKDTIDFSTVISDNLTYNRTNNDLIVVDNEGNSVTLKDYYLKPVAATLVCDDDTKYLTDIDSADYTTVTITADWGDLTFARPNGEVDLTITDKTTKTVYTYENYFDTVPFANVTTLDGALLVPHDIKEEATIYVTGVNNFVGKDYNEHVTVEYGEADSSRIQGNAGNDTLIGGSKKDELLGGIGDDYVFGGNGGEDVLMGEAGSDHIYAASGLDAKGNMTGVNKTGVTIYGGSGDDYLFGGKGDDTITGGAGNDVMYGNGGANTFRFIESDEYVNTEDTIVDATSKDTLEFTGMTINTALESTFTRQGDDLRIRAIVSDEYASYNKDVIINDYFVTSTKNRIDKFIVDGVEEKLSDYVVNKVVINNVTYPNGKYKGTDLNEAIDAAEYVSPNGKKGVTITTGKGENTITGSLFNDTVTATKAAKLEIEETAGVNKITSGNGENTVELNAGTNTVKLGNAMAKVDGEWEYYENTVTIAGGKNKVTSGKGADIVTTSAGVNTLNLGNGENEVTINEYDGEEETPVYTNTVTTGKDADTFTVADGINVIKGGAGVDTYTLNGGINTVTAGNGAKVAGVLTGNTFNLNDGVNTVKSGSANDTFTITGGVNVIDGGAGVDTYDVSAYAGDAIVSITDKSGSSTMILDDFVDVALSITNVKQNKVKEEGEWVVDGAKSFKIGKDIEFGESVLFTGKDAYSVNKVVIDEETYTISKANVNALAQEVANWLADEGFVSTADAIDKGHGDELMAVFHDNVDKYYGGPI